MRFQFDSKFQKIGAIVGVLLICSSPAFAIFGIGDVVFDPSSYATLGTIYDSDVSNGLKIAEEVAQATKILNNGIQMYTLAMQMATFIEHKEFFQAVGFLSSHVKVANIGGETAGWDTALVAAGGAANAALAWQRASQPGTSLLARINLADSMGTDALMVIGNCNQNALANDGAIGALEQIAISSGSSANTTAALGNVQNMAATQQLRTQQCQHAMENERLKQMSLETLRYRDLESQSLTTFNTIDLGYASNPVGMSNVSSSLAATIY
jgi:hypothetical protein